MADEKKGGGGESSSPPFPRSMFADLRSHYLNGKQFTICFSSDFGLQITINLREEKKRNMGRKDIVLHSMPI